MEILDSGTRREFDSGAVRDIQEGKGRCDLLPLNEIGFFINAYDEDNPEIGIIIEEIDSFMKDRFVSHIYNAIDKFIEIAYNDEKSKAILELAMHYEEGSKKYAERNWEKGMPFHCFIDSGIRHLLKWYGKWTDEPHDRAFLWNMFGLIWTSNKKDEMDDLPEQE